MKRTTITLTLLAALSAMGSAQASEFDGGFVGAKAGYNYSGAFGCEQKRIYPGPGRWL